MKPIDTGVSRFDLFKFGIPLSYHGLPKIPKINVSLGVDRNWIVSLIINDFEYVLPIYWIGVNIVIPLEATLDHLEFREVGVLEIPKATIWERIKRWISK
jgi:hypothetical protein